MHQYKSVEYIDVSKIEDHPDIPNIRSEVNKADVKELILSIKKKGVQNPLTVFKGVEKYFLISGWRRREAVREIVKEDPKSKLKSVPILVKEYDKDTFVKDALYDNAIENIQRKDVNPYDQAMRIKMLLDMGIGKQEICSQIGKSSTWLTETLNVLNADPEVIERLKKGDITISDAKRLAKLPQETQSTIAKGLSAAKTSGDKKTTQKIQKGMENVTRSRSHVAPAKQDIKYNKNLLMEIIIAMKEKKETKTEQYYVLSGCLKTLQWCLGETGDVNFVKIAEKYGIKIGKDGSRLKEKPKTAKPKTAKPAKKKATKKKATKKKSGKK